MNDTATANSHIRVESPTPGAPVSTQPAAPSSTHPTPDEFDGTAALLRLLLGAALQGMDELRLRLRQWDASMRAASPLPAPKASSADLLRFAALGMLFESETTVRRGLFTLGRMWGEAARTALDALAPRILPSPLDPVVTLFDEVLFEWTVTVDRWIAMGSREESQSRLMARRAIPGILEEFVELLAKNPDVRALIAQEGANLTGTAVQDVRERVGSADALVERLVQGLLRRPANNDSPNSAQP
jgi:hypothetical protein